MGNTKPTWNLSADGLTYSKTFDTNQEYITKIQDIYGNEVTIPIKLKKKQEELSKCQTEISLMSESVREYRDDNEQLSKLNKELKFELQSYKYKVLDLQNKLFENQMTPTKEQKEAAQKQGK